MGKFDRCPLVSDFDDTLYDSHCQVPGWNLEALDLLPRPGGAFYRGHRPRPTGPSLPMSIWPPSMPRWSSPTGRPSMTSKKTNFWCRPICVPVRLRTWMGMMEAFPQLGMEAYHGEDIYVFRPNWITDLHMKKVGTDYTVCPIREMPTPWIQSHPPAGPRGAEGGAELASGPLPPPV